MVEKLKIIVKVQVQVQVWDCGSDWVVVADEILEKNHARFYM